MSNAITTLAWIKSNWDQSPHKDYIDQFIPFLVTLARRRNYHTVDVETICKDFRDEFGLKIPYHPMVSLLNRAKKRGYIKKDQRHTYHFISEKVARDDFSDVAAELQRKYNYVIQSFISHCQAHYQIEFSEDKAEEIFIAFLKKHDLDILFASDVGESVLPDAHASVSESYLIQDFIKTAYEKFPDVFSFIVNISMGHIISNALLYQGIERFKGKFKGLQIYLDSGFLFRLLGINGDEKAEAYKDFVQILHQHKVSLFVFRHTYDEFRGILENCLYWMERGGIDISKASRALLYFLDNGFKVTDVEQYINSIDDKLAAFNIEVVNKPDVLRDQYFQIDESKLTDIIIELYKTKVPNFDEIEKEFTIYQDVQSISAIYKLRAGRAPSSLRKARYIFMTTNASLAHASALYEREFLHPDFFTIPAALTDVFVGTLIWIYSPTAIEKVNQKKIISDCYAAMQPSRHLRKVFINTVERLLTRGDVSEEEAILLKESRSARNLLQEKTLGDPDLFTDKTPLEILEDIRNQIRMEERKKTEQYKSLLESEKSKREMLERALADEQRKRDILVQRVEKFAVATSKIISCFWFILALIFVGILLFPHAWSTQYKPWVQLGSFLLSLASAATGFHLNQIRVKISEKVKNLGLSLKRVEKP